jgi:hypothetical protein
MAGPAPARLAPGYLNQPYGRCQRHWCRRGRCDGIRRLLVFRRCWHVRFNRSKQVATCLRNLPAFGIAQHQRLTEDIEARCARGQAFRSVRPIPTAGNENSDRTPKIGERRSSFRMSSQDFQNRNLKAHHTPRDANCRFLKTSTRESYLAIGADVYRGRKTIHCAKVKLFAVRLARTVPALTRSRDIQLNKRVPLSPHARSVA